MRPGVLKFYKGTGAAAFSLIPPQYDNGGYMSKQGAVLLEAAPSVGKQQWDWDQKITFAISIQDVADMLDSDAKKRRIYHKHQDTAKVLEFVPGQGDYAGTFMMNLSLGTGDNRKVVRVPFSNGEWTVLVRMLLSACPLMLAWSENAIQNQNRGRGSRA